MSIQEYSYNLVKKFIEELPSLWHSMKITNHGMEMQGKFPDYHLGESIWTHTLMVLSHMISQLIDSGQNLTQRNKNLLIAALLHDIGKPKARFYKEQADKYVFYGHAGISTFEALGVIEKIDSEITIEEKIKILELINYHQVLFDITSSMSQKSLNKLAEKFDNVEIIKDLMLLRYCDFSGNISKKEQNTDYQKVFELMDIIDSKQEKFDNDDKPVLTLLVGLPCSGKSTYCEKNSLRVVSRDYFVMLYAKDKTTYTHAFESVDHKFVDEMHEKLISSNFKARNSFTIDRTNLTYKGRKKFINRAKQNGFNVQIKLFLPKLDVIFNRNEHREGKEIPYNVMLNMMKSFDMPLKSEGVIEYFFGD